MKRAKFGIKTLLFLTTVVAIALVLNRPFSPQIQFTPIATGLCNADNEKIVSNYHMSLTNKGLVPVWLAGSSESIPACIHASGYSQQAHHSALRLDDLILAVNKKVYWIRLGPDKSISIDLGPAMKRIHVLGVNVRDWRGREAEVWSHAYVPPHR